MCASEINSYLIGNLTEFDGDDNQIWPCFGGSFPKVQVPTFKLLLTVHANNTIYINDATIRALITLYEIRLPSSDIGEVSALAFDPASRVIAVGCTKGDLFVYKFRYASA